MSRPFRFSVSIVGATRAPEDVDSVVRRVDELGYDGISISDHLDDQVGPLVGLTTAALASSRLTLTALVLANDYRHPAVLAKELATLDRVAAGRLEVGIGAGWMTADYQRAGLPFDRPGVRIRRLGESITVLKGCFADGPFDFHGEFYDIDQLDSLPAPAQRPHPRLLVAGGGPRVLTLAAEEADIVGINPGLAAGVIDDRAGPTATPAATDEKLAVVRDAAGDRFDDLELQTRIHLAAVTDDRIAMAHAMAPALGIDPDDALESPHALVGTHQECIDTLRRWRDRWGISYVTWNTDAMEALAPVVELLAGT